MTPMSSKNKLHNCRLKVYDNDFIYPSLDDMDLIEH